MIFRPTPLQDALLIELERHEDERGFFARSFCEEEFAANGLHRHYPQCNISWNRTAGTLRGMHYQRAPHAEVKLVRCIRGAIFDVIIDLRRTSPTWLQWTGVQLNADNRLLLYIPAGFAHGFLTLCDDAEVFYHMGHPHHAGAAAGLRWNDARFNITWPRTPTVMSDRDRNYADFDAATMSE